MILALSLLLAGCGGEKAPETAAPTIAPTEPAITEPVFENVTDIILDGDTVTAGGQVIGAESESDCGVFVSRDIVYYEDKEAYESGYPYGEGDDWERHTAQEAEAHTVVNITRPGNYRLSGQLSLGQIRIDLGENAGEDADAVVNLILDGVDITCTVAPAILFRNVYECDGNWSVETAKPDVDTSAAGANLILASGSVNVVKGSHVAKIYKDKEGEKKLWKQDGALYSYMSMNIYGPGALEIQADNEGLGSELHLTIFGGDITIRSGNDGINTNEDGVSVTAIHGGTLRVLAGLGEEGDGIDSNGYLVIYGGTVIAAAHPASDAGLDSDLGSFIHGGTVIALGAPMDWAESDSEQVTMNLQFAEGQTGDIRVLREDGTELFAFSPAEDPVLSQNPRSYRGMILSCPGFRVGEGCHVFVEGIQMGYTGTDVMHGPGTFKPGEDDQRPVGGIGIPEDRDDMPEPPEGDVTLPPQPSEGMEPVPQGTPPTWPGGTAPDRTQGGQPQTLFFLQDKVNFFTGLAPAQ